MKTQHTPGPWTISADGYDATKKGFKFLMANQAAKGDAASDARLIAAAPDLLAELEATASLCYELMERAATIDERLILVTKSPRDGHELGEIVRLRVQLSKNRAACAKAKGEAQ